MRYLLFAILVAFPTMAAAQNTLTQERWLQHLKEDLLRFWDMPAAHGEPVGMYPSMRCNDGSVFQPKTPCAEIGDIQWMTPDQNFLIAISRQSFAYLAAFHMTGDRRLLDLGKAGIDTLMGAARHPEGGHYEGFDQASGLWWREADRFTVQKQAYGLLAPAFYYYLTRDESVLQMIEAAQSDIFARYLDPDTGEYWSKDRSQTNRNTTNSFTSYLDQLNTFYILMARSTTGETQSNLIANISSIADIMVAKFQSERYRTFHLSGAKLSDPTARPAADYGHAAKAYWFLAMVGDLQGNTDLIKSSFADGKAILNESLNTQQGAWSQGFTKKGKVARHKSSWVYAEQSQLLASLALTEPRLTGVLDRVNNFWLTYFVDTIDGGIFDSLNKKNLPPKKRGFPKHWAWKSGFHEFEHALVAYITASRFQGKPLRLHYAFDAAPAAETIRPYYFSGDLTALDVRDDGVSVATFTDIAFP